MGQLAYSVVGAAVGYYVGGPTGAQYGWAIGGMVGSVIDPPKIPDGPRLDDLSVQVSTYGQHIARRFGTVRITGNVIWATPLIETASESGGKGGSSQTTYSYSCSFAVALCEGPATGVSRIWADGKLIYDIRPSNTGNQIGFTATSFVVYPGTETQDVDPTIEAYMGDTPAYRGLVYVVFTELQLARYGNRIPNLSFEVCDGPETFLEPEAFGEKYQPPSDTGGSTFRHDLSEDGVLWVGTMDGHATTESYGTEDVSMDFVASSRPQVQAWNPITKELIYRYNVPLETVILEFGSMSCYPIEGAALCIGNRFYIGRGSPGGDRRVFDALCCPATCCASPAPYIHGYSFALDSVPLAYRDTASSGQFQNAFYWPSVPHMPELANNKLFWMSANGITSDFGVGFDAVTGAQLRPERSGCRCDANQYPGEFDGESQRSPDWTYKSVLVDGRTMIQGYGHPGLGTDGSFLVSSGTDPGDLIPGSAVTMPPSVWDAARGQLWVFGGDDNNLLYSGTTFTDFVFPVADPPLGLDTLRSDRVRAACVDKATGNLRLVMGGGVAYNYSRLVLFNPDTQQIISERPLPTMYLANNPGKMWDFPAQRFALFANDYRIWKIPYGSTLDPQPIYLWEIVLALSLAAGMDAEDVDVTELTDLVWGYVIARQGSTRSAIEQLMVAFMFDAVESEGKVKFVKRGKTPARDIDADDLCVHALGQERPVPLALTRVDEAELPKVVTVKYINQDTDYQTGTQEAQRMTTRAEAMVTIDVPVSMKDAHAKSIADTSLYQTWVARNRVTWSTTLKHADLEPTDVVRIDGNPIRISKRALDGNILRFDGEFDSGTILTAGAVAGSGAPYPAPPPGVETLPLTDLMLLDIPLLADADDGAGFYAGARGYAAPWPGALLLISADGGGTFTSLTTFNSAAANGAAVTALGAFDDNLFDEFNTVTVTTTGTLSSSTELAVLNGANVALLGSELIQYKRAVLNVDNSYTLSGLLRGRKGTLTTGHIAGERFVPIDANIQRIAAAPATIGLSRIYKAPTLGATVESASSIYFINTALGLLPLSGVSLGGGRDAAGNLTVNWTRRTRLDGGWRDNVDAGLGETSENYAVDIYDGPSYITLKRTVAATAPTITYTAAEQTADFGAPQSAVSLRIYQISATVGRGATLEGTV